MEVKYPILELTKYDARIIHWWEGKDIAFHDHIPENYPADTLGTYEPHEFEQYMKRTQEMIDKEGWKVIQDRRSEINDGPWH